MGPCIGHFNTTSVYYTNWRKTTSLTSTSSNNNSLSRPRYVGNGKLFHFWVNTFFIDQQRTSSLTHDSSLGAPAPPASRSIRVTPVTPGWPPEPDVPPRGWRSAHTSGDNLDPDSPLPNPRVLTNSLSHGHTSDPHCQGSSEDQVRQMSSIVSAACTMLLSYLGDGTFLATSHFLRLKHLSFNFTSKSSCYLFSSLQSEDTSPLSQSCAASAQTIPSHPPAKTVSIVDYYSQVGHQSSFESHGLYIYFLIFRFIITCPLLLASKLEYHEFLMPTWEGLNLHFLFICPKVSPLCYPFPLFLW